MVIEVRYQIDVDAAKLAELLGLPAGARLKAVNEPYDYSDPLPVTVVEKTAEMPTAPAPIEQAPEPQKQAELTLADVRKHVAAFVAAKGGIEVGRPIVVKLLKEFSAESTDKLGAKDYAAFLEKLSAL